MNNGETLRHIAANPAMAAPYGKASGSSKPILQRANELVGGNRQASYGDKLNNQAQIAMLMQGYLARKLQPGAVITPEDACNLVICIKLARLSRNPQHDDSLLDVAGYVAVIEALQLEREQRAAYPLQGAIKDSGARPLPVTEHNWNEHVGVDK